MPDSLRRTPTMDLKPASMTPGPTKNPLFTKLGVLHSMRVRVEVIGLFTDFLRQAGLSSGLPGGDFAQPLHEKFGSAATTTKASVEQRGGSCRSDRTRSDRSNRGQDQSNRPGHGYAEESSARKLRSEGCLFNPFISSQTGASSPHTGVLDLRALNTPTVMVREQNQEPMKDPGFGLVFM
jgi:hypothetical protein